MSDLLTVALLALLPPAGGFIGGLLAETLPVTDRWLNRALHAAAGVVIAIVAFEIFPQALDVAAPWVLAVAFLAGGLLYMAAQALTQDAASEQDEGNNRMWMIYLAAATDLFGDGLLLGAGASVSTGLGFALGLGQVLANIPEGFASIFTFRANDVQQGRRFLLSASFFVPTLLGAAIAYPILRDASEAVQHTALVVTAGLFTVAAFEDMIQEAHETQDDSRISTLALIGGFALFGFISGALA